MHFSLIKVAAFCIFLSLISLPVNGQKKEYYQLKTYTVKSESQEKMVDAYLEHAFLPSLKRYGINSVGVFKLHNSKFVKADEIHVLIPFSSLIEFEGLEQFLLKDKAHLADGKSYLQATLDNPPYENITSVLMRAFTNMPKMKPSTVEGAKTERIYELRSYESPTEAAYKNKVHMFNEGGEVELFDRLGFNAVFYAEVISGDAMPNLMYMTTFSDMNKRDDLWKAFFASTKWTELINDDFYKNNMKKADIMLLYPTSYSDY